MPIKYVGFCNDVQHRQLHEPRFNQRLRCTLDAPLKPAFFLLDDGPPPADRLKSLLPRPALKLPPLLFFQLSSSRLSLFENCLLEFLPSLSDIFFFSILALLAAGPDSEDFRALLTRAENKSAIK